MSKNIQSNVAPAPLDSRKDKIKNSECTCLYHGKSFNQQITIAFFNKDIRKVFDYETSIYLPKIEIIEPRIRPLQLLKRTLFWKAVFGIFQRRIGANFRKWLFYSLIDVTRKYNTIKLYINFIDKSGENMFSIFRWFRTSRA